MLKIGLKIEEREAIAEMLDSEGFRVLVKKILPALIEFKRERLFSQTLTEPNSFTQLALTRAEVDGAKRLATDMVELKKFLKQTEEQ